MEYKLLLKLYEEEMLKVLKDLVAIPSVYDEKSKTKSKPFGENVDKALKFVGKLGESLGFSVDYCDGYATELTIGEGDKLISIFAHADVVPTSGEWLFDPFKLTIKDGKMYGRGTSDDKGPFIAALYAGKALYEAGKINGYRLRLVVGGDEERGSSCLDYYFNNLKKEDPTYGFTPDSDFPLIYGEKGISDFFPTLKVSIPGVKSISGGVVTNAVCDKVKVVADKDEEFYKYLKENKIDFAIEKDGLTFLGKSCHGSMPQHGVNAALICLKSYGDFYNIESLKLIGEKLLSTSGKDFGLYTKTKLLGETTYCVGKINYSGDLLTFSVNFRYPESVNRVDVITKFDSYFGTKSTYGEESHHLLYNPKCKLVKTLLKAYRKETKDKTAPLTTGGGTYAKHAKNTVAFGAVFPGRETAMHEPNEFFLLQDFYDSAVIYAHAIDLLGKLK